VMGGVEEGNNADSAFDEGEGIIQDYTPHFVAGAKYASGIWGASVTGAWDSVQEEFSVKGRIDVTPNDMFSFFVMGAWTDDNGDGVSVVNGVPFDSNGGNFYATWGGDWGLWTGGAVHINDRLTLNAEFGLNELSDYSVDVDLNVVVVPGFVVTPGVGFRHGDGEPLSPFPDDDQWGGYLRTQFTF
jgi:porin-like protein